MNQLRNNKGGVRVPHDRLSTEILEAVIEEFVTREGTDYGTTDAPFERKVEQVKKQLETGRAVIVFDESMQSCTILQKDDPRLRDIEGDR